ncbi:GNAT family N-acetyltransferase [Luteimonas sp. RD2P54]|uniref:GNAT family N-acetyltransferase n=1 Tax=Luteimonas endophytica TaxID=3042023 RepID=A0ABT6JEP3_9GAMM|nr:GNAT family N-acetyltransferase [Luteimonas endophytica]MDH5825035.1 GNAT family N-acetyltransferase [Luteimonas endophytica]
MPAPIDPCAEPAIRVATEGDVDGVLALVDRLTLFGPPAHREVRRMAEVDRQVLAAAIADQHAGQGVFVIDGVAGIAAVLHMSTLVDYYHRRPNAHVSTLIVDAAAEGQGLGRRLLAHAEAWARGRGDDWMTLTVFPGNTRAVGLYERSGFVPDMPGSSSR